MKTSKYNYFVPTKDEDVFMLYNTLHGSIFIVDNEIRHLLESNNIDEIKNEILEEYIREKVVVEDELDEKQVIKVRQDKSKFDSQITSVTLLTTYDCNLRCIYCYEGAGEHLRDSVDGDTARRIVDYIKNQTIRNRSRYLFILLYGGEPLLNYEIAKHMLSELHTWSDENNITFNTAIATNGTLLNRYHLDDLSTFNVHRIQITLDGPKECHDKRRVRKNGLGTYERIIESLKMVQDHESVPNPLIRINIDSENAGTVPELLDDLKEEGLDKSGIDLGILQNSTPACSSFSSCLSESEISAELPRLWREGLKRGFRFNLRPRQAYVFCGSLRDSCYIIDPKGNLYKCWDHVGMEEYKIASIQDELVEPGSPEYFAWMSRDALEIPECRNCILLPACGGGCAALAYVKRGTYKAPGCFKVKYVIEEQLKIYLETKYPEKFKKGGYVGEWVHSF